MRRLRQGAWALGALGICASAALAQNGAAAPGRPTVLAEVGMTVLYSLIGIGMAILGFKLFDWATPFKLEEEVCEKQNIAAGILSAAVVLGACLIIAMVVD